MRDYILIFKSDELVLIGYTDLDFQFDKDFHQSIFDFVFTLGGATINYRIMKQSCIANPTMKVKYVKLFSLESSS